MALLNDSVEAKKLDVRMIERNLARGVVSPDEVEKAQKKLPDDSENADWVSLDALESAEDSDLNGKSLSQH